MPQSPSPAPSANVINDEEVRNLVTSNFRAEERGDFDYLISQYDDSFTWGAQRRDKAWYRNRLNAVSKEWPVKSFTVGDIRVEHSFITDALVTAYFDYRFSYRNPASGRSNSGHASAEWGISKTSGALRIVSQKITYPRDSPAPSITPAGGR